MALKHSVHGIKFALSKHTAFKQELLVAIILTPLGLLLGETGVEKALLIGSIFLVLIVELINSSIETTIDRIGLEKNDLSRHSKDMASGAVFISLLNLLMIWYLVIVY
tara:strand:+ start:7239 stop:7562 length:324 start_codon:yes stop_codon:yes gene_type:complete